MNIFLDNINITHFLVFIFREKKGGGGTFSPHLAIPLHLIESDALNLLVHYM